jgi:hypothetical protein
LFYQRQLFGCSTGLMPFIPKFGPPTKAIYLQMSDGITGDPLWYATFHSDTLALIGDEGQPNYLQTNFVNAPKNASVNEGASFLSNFQTGVTEFRGQQGGPIGVVSADQFSGWPNGVGGFQTYHGMTNATSTIPTMYPGLWDPTSQFTISSTWCVAPDRRYAYNAVTWDPPSTPPPSFGGYPAQGGAIVELDMANSVVTRTWTFGPPYGGSVGSGSTTNFAYAVSISATSSMVWLVCNVSVGSWFNAASACSYNIDRASGSLTQWASGGVWTGESSTWSMSPNARYKTQSINLVNDLTHQEGFAVRVLDNVAHSEMDFTPHPYTDDVTFGQPLWQGMVSSAMNATYSHWSGAAPSPNLCTDWYSPVDGHLVAGGPNVYSPAMMESPRFILSNGNSLGIQLSADTSGNYWYTFGVLDNSFSLVATGPFPPSTSNTRIPLWVSDDESYVLVSYTETGTFDARGELNRYGRLTTADHRFSVLKLSLPGLSVIGQTQYVYANTQHIYGSYYYPGITGVFEMMNLPVIFTAPPQRQFPREDHLGLGGARQSVSRGRPKSKQYSTRQGFKGTYS